MGKRFDKNGVGLFCGNCEKRIDINNSFTWLIDGKIANIRFCSAKCCYEYCKIEKVRVFDGS